MMAISSWYQREYLNPFIKVTFTTRRRDWPTIYHRPRRSTFYVNEGGDLSFLFGTPSHQSAESRAYLVP